MTMLFIFLSCMQILTPIRMVLRQALFIGKLVMTSGYKHIGSVPDLPKLRWA